MSLLCYSCSRLPADVVVERKRTLVTRPGWHRLRNVVCNACGRLLPAEDPDGRLLDRLTRLARFGLGAGGTPILKP